MASCSTRGPLCGGELRTAKGSGLFSFSKTKESDESESFVSAPRLLNDPKQPSVEGERLIDTEEHFRDVRVSGVDEHVVRVRNDRAGNAAKEAVAAVQPRVTQGPRPVQVGRPANHGLATCVIHRVIRHVDAEKAVAIRDLLWLHVQMDEHLDECAGRRGGGVQHGSSLAVPSTRRKQAAATIQTGVTAQSPEPQAKIPCSICSNRSVT